jgi:hypothetical protein
MEPMGQKSGHITGDSAMKEWGIIKMNIKLLIKLIIYQVLCVSHLYYSNYNTPAIH